MGELMWVLVMQWLLVVEECAADRARARAEAAIEEDIDRAACNTTRNPS